MCASSNLSMPGEKLPYAFFVGDFNTGKSALINALLRRESLAVSREESRALPTFLGRGSGNGAFAGVTAANEAEETSPGDFRGMRQGNGHAQPYVALAAHLPEVPFSRLVLVDTAGLSSDHERTLHLHALQDAQNALFIVVTDIEYWFAKHTLDFIAEHHELFGQRLLVVANKADGLNATELRRVINKAPRRLKEHGIKPAPEFFAVSARLEAARGDERNELRRRVKPTVRALCDAGFDALRVRLYEFEAAHAPAVTTPLEALTSAPVAASFLNQHEGAPA